MVFLESTAWKSATLSRLARIRPACGLNLADFPNGNPLEIFRRLHDLRRRPCDERNDSVIYRGAIGWYTPAPRADPHCRPRDDCGRKADSLPVESVAQARRRQSE